MQNVGIAFEVLENYFFPPVVWRKVTVHLVFDVEIDFKSKTR